MLSARAISRLWYDFVSCRHAFGPEDPHYRRVYLINAMMLVVVLVCLFFAVFNLLLTGYYDIAVMDLIALVLTVLVLADLRRNRNVRRSSLLALIVVAGALIAFVVLSQGQDYGLIWLATLPPFAFFLLGVRWALVVVLSGWAVLLAAMVLFGAQWPEWSYSVVMVANVAGALLALIGLIAYYEYTRSEASGKLATLNRTLQARIDAALGENLSQQELLIQRAKMADLGEAFGMLAHQWKQPLTVSVLAADVLDNRIEELSDTKEGLRYYTATLKEQLHYMRQTVDDFQAFMRPDRRCAPFGPYGALLGVVKLYGPVLKKREIDLVITADEQARSAQVYGYQNEFMQALLNLLSNASDAIVKQRSQKGEFEGEIVLLLERRGASLVLEISDNGCGLSEAIRPRLFELFATDKGAAGNGLGLYMSRVIIERMQGEITIENQPAGAQVQIVLPVMALPAASAKEAPIL